MGGTNGGPGNRDIKKIQKLAEEWGNLPPKERAKAMRELTREYPPQYREVIREYFRKVTQQR